MLASVMMIINVWRAGSGQEFKGAMYTLSQISNVEINFDGTLENISNIMKAFNPNSNSNSNENNWGSGSVGGGHGGGGSRPRPGEENNVPWTYYAQGLIDPIRAIQIMGQGMGKIYNQLWADAGGEGVSASLAGGVAGILACVQLPFTIVTDLGNVVYEGLNIAKNLLIG